MNIRVNNGQRTIKLTQGERATLLKAVAICDELEKQWQGGPWQIADDAGTGLARVLAQFEVDGTQSKPEAATTK